MKHAARAVIAAAAMAFALPAAAQDAAPASCELHVWPAAEIKSVTQGWWWNHTVNQAFDQSLGGATRPKVLGPERQVEMLRELDLPALFQLAPAAVTFHPEPLARTATASKARLSASTSACYSELVVSQNFFDSAPLAPKALRSLLVLRKFGEAPEAQSSFSTWADTSLLTFPAKTADKAEAADREIAAAYLGNIQTFAGYANKPPRKKK